MKRLTTWRPLRYPLFACLFASSLATAALATPSTPWEGSDNPTPYTVVNTHTGVPTTVVHLGGWKSRGLSIDFNVFDSPDQDPYAIDDGGSQTGMHGSWTHTYSAYIEQTSEGWLLHEADGTMKVFTTSGSTFTETAGYFDKLAITTHVVSGLGTTVITQHTAVVTRTNGTTVTFYGETTSGSSEDDLIGGGGTDDVDDDFYLTGLSLHLTDITDRNGNNIHLYYYTSGTNIGRLRYVYDPTGNRLEFTYPDSVTTVVKAPAATTGGTQETWTLNWAYNSTNDWYDLASIVNTGAGSLSRTFSFVTDNSSSNPRVTALTDWLTHADSLHASYATWSFTYDSSSEFRLDQVDGPSWMVTGTRPQRLYSYVTTGSSSPATIVSVKTGLTSPAYLTTEHDYFVLSGGTSTPTDSLSSVITLDSAGANSQTSYTWTGNLLTGIAAPAGNTTLTYNSGTSDITLVDSYTGSTTFGYNDSTNAHLPTIKTDQSGKSTVYKYNAAGNLTDVWDANHPTSDSSPSLAVQHTHYTVGSTGLVTDVSNFSVSGSMPADWHYTYDSNGNLSGIQRPGETASSTTMGYDSLGNRVWSKRYASETATNFVYDGFNRLSSVAYNGTTPSITYGYDVNGAMNAMTDQSGSTSWTLDAIDQPLTESKDGHSIQWTYNASGSRATMTNWNSDVTTYNRYVNGQLQDVAGPWLTGQSASFTYACDCGELASVTLPYQQHVNELGTNNGSIGWEYVNSSDSSAGMGESDPTGVYDFSATPEIDISGPDSITRSQNFDALGTGYPLDAMYRTVEESMTSGFSGESYSYEYTLDDVGNRAVLTTGSNTLNFSYDTAGQNRLTLISDPSNPYGINDGLGYDSSNNLSDIVENHDPYTTEYDFAYTPANQLSTITRIHSGSSVVSGLVYDGLGRLAQQTDAAGHVYHLYYDGNHLAFETDSAGAHTAAYQWADKMLLSQKQTNSGVTHTYWYLEDALGNVIGLVDGANSNTLVAHYAYDAFGNLLPSSSDTLTIPNPLRYRGMLDYQYLYGFAKTGTNSQHTFYSIGARTYDSGTGRWLQEDPIAGITGDPLSFNRYLYCDADPVLNIDPSGLNTVAHNGKPCHAPSWFPYVAEPVLTVGGLIVGSGVGIEIWGLPALGTSAAANLGTIGLGGLGGYYGEKLSHYPDAIWCLWADPAPLPTVPPNVENLPYYCGMSRGE